MFSFMTVHVCLVLSLCLLFSSLRFVLTCLVPSYGVVDVQTIVVVAVVVLCVCASCFVLFVCFCLIVWLADAFVVFAVGCCWAS